MKEETKKKTTAAKKSTSAATKKTTSKVSTKKAPAKTSTKKTTKSSAKKAAPKKVVKEVKVETPVKEEKVKKLSAKEVEKTKEEKKATKKESKEESKFIENSEITNLIKIIVVLVVIFLLFYGITYFVAKARNKKNTDDTKTVSFDYSTIMMCNLLEQVYPEYLVFAIDKDETYYEAYSSLMSLYTGKADTLPVYRVDLNSKFNSSFYDKTLESSVIDSNISNLKVNKSTIFRVKNGNIEASYVGHDAIVNYLNEALK